MISVVRAACCRRMHADEMLLLGHVVGQPAMLSRRIRQAVVPSASAVVTQKRFDTERWYGHALELDVWNYKYSNEIPKWMRYPARSAEETEDVKGGMPHVDFATSYEALIFDADRLNAGINRKEFANEKKFRLEKQANTVARSQMLIREGTYAKDAKVEDRMIARIADDEHMNAEMKYVKCIRANEVSEDNRLDILPGGSPNSLREKARWNMPMELHPADRNEIMVRLMAWLPEKYHVVYHDDFQTVAANDASCRSEMLAIIDNVEKEHMDEAKASSYEADLQEVCAELRDEVDPTRHVTPEKIKASSNLDELEEWSRLVHEYNGDERIMQIYERAAEITGNEKHKALLKTLRGWQPATKSYATAKY